MNRLTEAEPLFRRALAIDEKNLGSDDPKVAGDLFNLGLVLGIDQQTEAEQLSQRASSILLKSSEPSSAVPPNEDLGKLTQQVTQLYQAHKFSEATAVAERCVVVARSWFGQEDSRFAAAVFQLAFLYRGQGKYLLAEPLYRQALAINETILGPNPTVASNLSNLAAVLQDLSQLPEAELFFRRALAVDQKSLGPEHPKVGTDLSNLSQFLQATNRFAEAEPHSRQALAIDETTLGSQHPDVARDLNNLGRRYFGVTNRSAEAEQLYRRAARHWREKSQVPTRPFPATDSKQPGRTCLRILTEQARGRAAFSARSRYRRGRAWGRSIPRVAIDLNNLAVLLADHWPAGRGRTALIGERFAIDEKSLGPEHPAVAKNLNNLAGLLQ